MHNVHGSVRAGHARPPSQAAQGSARARRPVFLVRLPEKPLTPISRYADICYD